MNVDLKNHLEIHLANPHLNYIVSHNCRYCKLDRRLQFGKLFQKPRTISRHNLNSTYYQPQASRFNPNRISQTIIYPNNTTNINTPTNRGENRIVNTTLNSPEEYNPDDYQDWEVNDTDDSQVSMRQLNNNSEVSIYLRGVTKPERCSICYDYIRSFQIIRTLYCQHHFHQKCIDKWLESKTNCPICRLGI